MPGSTGPIRARGPSGERVIAVFDDGVELYERGDYRAALELFRPDLNSADAGTRSRAATNCAACLIQLYTRVPNTAEGDPRARDLLAEIEALAPYASGNQRASILLTAAWERFGLSLHRGDLADLRRASELADATLTAAGDDWNALEEALVAAAHIRNSLDDALGEDPRERMPNILAAVAVARRAVALADARGPDRRPPAAPAGSVLHGISPSPAAMSHFALAKVLRLQSLRGADASAAREALDHLDRAQDLLEGDLTAEERQAAVLHIENCRALCWKDLRDLEGSALDNEIRAFEQIEHATGVPGGGQPVIERNHANALAARYLRHRRKTDLDVAYRLYRGCARRDTNPFGVEWTVANWANLAEAAGDPGQLTAAGETGLGLMEQWVARQRTLPAAKDAVIPISRTAGRLTRAYLAAGDLWRAASAIDRSRGVLLRAPARSGSTTDPDPIRESVALIRRAAATRTLCYLLADDQRLHAILIRGEDAPVLVTTAAPPDLEARALGYIGAASQAGRDYPGNFDRLLRWLSRYLWDAVMGAIAKHCPDGGELAIIAEGLLGFLPLHVAAPQTGPGLIERLDVSYPLSAAQLIATEQPGPPAPEVALIVASSGSGKATLDAVAGEVAAVGELLRPSFGDVVTCRATAEALAVLPRATIVHVASHAQAHALRPLGGSIVLDDGELDVDELAGLRLEAALVVLSACSTGLRAGLTFPAESLSLGTLFHRLGARCVLSTEWPIDDAVAEAIVVLFYEAVVREAEPPVRALRLAIGRFRRGEFDRSDFTRRYLAPLATRLARHTGRISAWAAFSLTGAGARPLFRPVPPGTPETEHGAGVA